jgi:hypothetical protein
MDVSTTELLNGAHLIVVQNVKLPEGWDRPLATVLFVAPPGYPTAQPDCFWLEPSGIRLAGGLTPQSTNDSNPIPGDVIPRGTTWFSWHLQGWDPNASSLFTYFKVILQRLTPAR